MYSIFKLKLKQAIGSFGPGSIARFLAPDFLVGVFLALSSRNRVDPNFAMRVGVVGCGIAIFTMVVETRKLFFTGGDVENFYFVQPTKISRLAVLSSIVVFNFVIILSVVVPVGLLTSLDSEFLSEITPVFISAVCFSTTFYLIILFVIGSFPRRIANLSLTILQIILALILLAVFQLPFVTENLFILGDAQPISGILFVISCSFFLVFPLQEKLVLKLKDYESDAGPDLLLIIKKFKRFFFMRSGEEEAGFLFFFSNIFRNQSFRLSTIGTAATPIMVAVYWTLRGSHFINLYTPDGFLEAESAAPIASLITAGILMHYFLAQNLLSSKDHDARWLFNSYPGFSFGKFVMGVRKALLVTIHIPITILIFLVAIQGNSVLESVITALTFYFLTHVAVSVFSIIQKNLPFTLPFARIGSQGTISLIFMLSYSTLITFVLLASYENAENLLMLNLFAFILVSILEFCSTGIIDRRIKLSA